VGSSGWKPERNFPKKKKDKKHEGPAVENVNRPSEKEHAGRESTTSPSKKKYPADNANKNPTAFRNVKRGRKNLGTLQLREDRGIIQRAQQKTEMSKGEKNQFKPRSQKETKKRGTDTHLKKKKKGMASRGKKNDQKGKKGEHHRLFLKDQRGQTESKGGKGGGTFRAAKVNFQKTLST